jgi:hypothetical protein
MQAESYWEGGHISFLNLRLGSVTKPLIVNLCINWSIAKLRRYVLFNHGITEYPDEHSSVSVPRKERYLNVPSLPFIQIKVLTRSTSALVVPQRTFGNEKT